MNNDIKVSVIVPSYKRAHLIGRAIKSILAQTYTNYEIVVVNDEPDVQTKEVVLNFRDARIIFTEHPFNKGISATRNTGVQLATGQLITFLDSDDEWLPSKLEKQVVLFAQSLSDTGVVYTERYDTVDGVKFTIPRSDVTKREGNILDTLLLGSLITLQTAMLRRECFASVGMFDVNCIVFEDWDIWLRIAKKFTFKYIEEPLVIIHSDPKEQHASKNFGNYVKSLEYILDKYQADFCNTGSIVLAGHYYYLASLLMRSKGNKVRVREYLMLAVKKHPLNPKYIAAYLLSCFGIFIKRG